MESTQTPTEGKRKTALYATHLALGARLVEFAGWQMPLQYRGILEEHRAVRATVGMFDVSHMGRIAILDQEARALLQELVVSDVASLTPGHARYSLLCREDGGILDDVILCALKEQQFLLVCNAANREEVIALLRQGLTSGYKARIVDRTEETVMVALQGPEAAKALAHVLGTIPALTLEAFGCWEGAALETGLFVSRTGYTGEDGFELVAEAAQGKALWQQFLEQGVKPCGLGARDTLRLEAGLLLHGQDMDRSTHPFEVGLGWTVHLEKERFLAKEALTRLKGQPLARRLVAFEMQVRGVPRHGYPIFHQGAKVGQVTSGGYAPTLDRYIGLGFVPGELGKVNTEIAIEIRGTTAPARIVRRPFYRRESAPYG